MKKKPKQIRGKKCKFCGQKFKRDKMSYNQKYCSVECRHKAEYIKRGGKEGQNIYNQKRLIAKFGIENLIKCEFCGLYFRQVGTHVIQKHNYRTAREYREDYGFDVGKGQLPKDYREIKKELVFKTGNVDNLKKGKKYRFKKKQEGLGRYKRSKQTLDRIRQQSFNKKDGGQK